MSPAPNGQFNQKPMRDWRPELLLVIAAAAFAGLAFRTARETQLDHTAFTFVGIPALLAALITVSPRPSSITGVVMKSTTLAMLIAGTLMGEAIVCLIMAAPLIYAIAFGVARTQERINRTINNRNGAALASLLLAIVVGMLAMEGVPAGWESNRVQRVSSTRHISASFSEIRAQLAAPMAFEQPLPRFFRLGFPTPGATSGSGLRVGDLRTVTMTHGHHPGTLVMKVAESRPGRVVFVPVSDDSYIVHWLSWRSAEVEWHTISENETQVTWTLEYRRRLDPSWYFAPLEQYGVGLAAGYLIETLARPFGIESRP